MLGDSLAQEPSSPEARENLELDPVQLSSSARESLESNSVTVSAAITNSPKVWDSLDPTSLSLASEALETIQRQASADSDSSSLPVEQDNNPQSQQKIDPTSLSLAPEALETIQRQASADSDSSSLLTELDRNLQALEKKILDPTSLLLVPEALETIQRQASADYDSSSLPTELERNLQALEKKILDPTSSLLVPEALDYVEMPSNLASDSVFLVEEDKSIVKQEDITSADLPAATTALGSIEIPENNQPDSPSLSAELEDNNLLIDKEDITSADLPVATTALEKSEIQENNQPDSPLSLAEIEDHNIPEQENLEFTDLPETVVALPNIEIEENSESDSPTTEENSQSTPLNTSIPYNSELSSTPLPSAATPHIATSGKRKRIFITGASGCIGHYFTEALINDTEHELFLLVRNPAKLRFDCNARPGINVIRSDMRYIFQHSKLLKTMDYVILAATSWGGDQQQVLDVNIYKILQLLNLLDPQVCQHIIYFSTASVLDRNNQILKEAAQLGTDYIRSKSDCLHQILRMPIAKKMTVLFPTLVLGGDEKHPYSHLSSGLPGVTKWIKLIRFFQADASFHYIHSQDIGQVVKYLIENPPKIQELRKFVLGNPAITVNKAVEEACAYLNQKILFRIPLYPWLADLLIALFKIEMAPWDRFCLKYRHFTYQDPVNPATFGLPVYCATFRDVLKVSGVPGGGGTIEPLNNYKFEFNESESVDKNEEEMKDF